MVYEFSMKTLAEGRARRTFSVAGRSGLPRLSVLSYVVDIAAPGQSGVGQSGVGQGAGGKGRGEGSAEAHLSRRRGAGSLRSRLEEARGTLLGSLDKRVKLNWLKNIGSQPDFDEPLTVQYGAIV
jgi:hypothetical protein